MSALASQSGLGSAINKDLAALRQATAAFHEFSAASDAVLWGLHAWVWAENPSGIFADWNPRVTCEHAADAMVMSH